MVIKKEVREALQKKIPGITSRRVNQIIKETQDRYRIVDRDIAGYVLAFEKKINLKKHLEPELIKEVQDAMQNGPKLEYKSGNGKTQVKNNEIKEEKSPYDLPLGKYSIDSELIADCKIQKPYRKSVSEALLTLETRIRKTLGLPDTCIGVDLISEAQKKGIFKRNVPAEEQGLVMLYKGSIMWLRNPPVHKKVGYTKEEAVKIVLFTDYLIKLFDELFNNTI